MFEWAGKNLVLDKSNLVRVCCQTDGLADGRDRQHAAPAMHHSKNCALPYLHFDVGGFAEKGRRFDRADNRLPTIDIREPPRLGTDRAEHLRTVRPSRLVDPKFAKRCFHAELSCVISMKKTRDDIGFAQKFGDKPILRLVIRVGGGVDLFDLAIPQDRQPIGDAHRFLLIVGHIYSCNSRRFAGPADLVSELAAKFRIEIAERLIQQKNIGLDDQGPRERDSLLLAAGKLGGLAVGVFEHLYRIERGHGLFLLFCFCQVADFQAERDVVVDRHVWPEGVALKNHAGVAFVGGGVCNVSVVEIDRAFGGVDEARDHAQKCCFTAAGGA